LNVAKHRNGRLGQVKLTFIADYPKFSSHASSDAYAATTKPLSSSGGEMPF
jgi:hypothetical protein